MRLKISKKYFTRDWWTTRLNLIVRDAEHLEDKHQITYTPAKFIFFAFLGSMVFFIFGFLAAGSFQSQANTGSESEFRAKMSVLQFKLDSLVGILETQNTYLGNIRKVLGGEQKQLKSAQTIKVEDRPEGSSPGIKVNKDSLDIDFLDKADLRLREEMEKNARSYDALSSQGGAESLSEMLLFTPIQGIVSQKFNAEQEHYGVDIVAAKDSPIKSVYDGTVILSSWTDETGYVIAVQHEEKLISVYKHCSRLLKESGDQIKKGDIVAIIGNTGKLSSGPHLHFELWHQGQALNPEEIIAF